MPTSVLRKQASFASVVGSTSEVFVRSPLLALALTACTAPLADAPLPPPGGLLELDAAPLVPLKKVPVTVLGAEAFADVWLAGSASGTGRGPCPPQLAGACLDLRRPVLLATGRANADGTAVLEIDVPPVDQPLQVHLQAASVGTTSTRTSQPILHWVQVSKRLDRGVWFWRDTGDPWGSAAVVGDGPKENAALARLACWGVRRVYASYDHTTPTWVTDVETWHIKLHANGRVVDLLLAENTWIDSTNWPNLQLKLQERLVDYHALVGATGRYDGVHLDIEPHALPGWSSATLADRRQDLDDLLATYQMVRTWMDANGHAALPLHVDLPVWFDNLPPALGGTGSVGWASVADRDQWFADVAATVDRVVLMAFDRPTVSQVQSGVSWELTALGGKARVALEADLGAGATWPTLSAFTGAMSGVEAGVGLSRATDIQSFSLLAPVWGP